MTQSETLAGFEIGRTSADRRGGQWQSREVVPQPSSSVAIRESDLDSERRTTLMEMG